MSAPTDDTELKDMVRVVTNYDASDVSDPDLDTHVKVAKMDVENDVGATDWYSDSGLGQVLLYTLAIGLKASLENHYVSAWDVGDEDIEVDNVAPEDSLQYVEWNDKIRSGLDNSDASGGSGTFQLTSNFDF